MVVVLIVSLKVLFESQLVKVPSLRVVEMYGAGQARVKGVDGAQDLDGLLDVGDRRADQRLLEGRALLMRVARRAVPGGRHHELVVVDLAVLDLDPVRERAARSFNQANAF